jgi:hypothetical protein
MSSNNRIISILFAIVELVIGIILSEIYINQYNIFTSEQTLEEFVATLIIIQFATVLILGVLNLILIKQITKRKLLRCIIASIMIGIVSVVLIMILPEEVFRSFAVLDCSRLNLLVVGLIIGFNWQLWVWRPAINTSRDIKEEIHPR